MEYVRHSLLATVSGDDKLVGLQAVASLSGCGAGEVRGMSDAAIEGL